MSQSINVLFLISEAESFVKVGGLGDVGGALPKALRMLSVRQTGGVTLDVRLVLPLHASIQLDPGKLGPMLQFDLPRSNGSLPVQVYQTQQDGVPITFISGEPIRKAKTVYSNDLAADREKYAFFSLAAVELIRHLDWRVDILHANDWHAALGLYALKSSRKNPAFRHVRGLLTLHNLPYMGGDGGDVLAAYKLSPAKDKYLPEWARSVPLPLGLYAADAVVAVSPQYGREILTAEFGCGLEGFLERNKTKLMGILNGIDVVSNNPATDAALAAHFSIDTLDQRPVNKRALQQKADLPLDPDIPVLGMVGRVDPQKGVDLVLEALRRIADRPWQAVLLGSGESTLEAGMRALEADFGERVRAVTRYDPQLGRMIYGGADILMMPSRYEPCGLAQMIAMRYGCVPVVRATGGLKDTVRDGRTGFHIPEATTDSLADSLLRALKVWSEPVKWRRIQQAGMRQDFSWKRSALQYADLYQNLLVR